MAETSDLPVGRPEEHGLDGEKLAQFDGRTDNFHSLLVVRHGELVFERYFAGEDERLGAKLGEVAFGPDTIHDLRSVTKSVTSLLIGAALDRGLLAGVDEPALGFFPEYADLRTAERDRILLRHLLTMSMGVPWDETLPYSDPRNSERQMGDAPDPVRYVLEQPPNIPPGKAFLYNGGATAVLAAILGKVAGKPLDAFAQKVLFDPLGIGPADWLRYRDGQPMAAAGLRLRPRDMAKIGQLVIRKGDWLGRQVISPAWIEESTRPHITAEGLMFYGYQWWLGRSLVLGREVKWASAVGNGGQRIYTIPGLDLVVVTTAGQYNDWSKSALPSIVMNKTVLEAVRE